MSDQNWVWIKEGKIYLALYVQPKASKTEISGIHNDRLKIRVNAPPVDGQANQEVIKFLSKKLKTPKTQIQILRGDTGREKLLLINAQESEETLNLIRKLI